jgi:N-acetylmuramidase/Putative peptidoglycan binding domain
MNDAFSSSGAPLTQRAFDLVRERLDVPVSTLWALLTVETRGFGYLPDRRPKVLFERHVFHKRTAGRFAASNPKLSSPEPGGYLKDGDEYTRVNAAMRLNRRVALESASWGLGQTMGFNALRMGYSGVEAMIDAYLTGEDEQLDGVLRFVEGAAPLKQALQKKQWATVAFHYNGKSYKKNKYDEKLDHFQQAYELKDAPSLEVRAAQARLLYLGYQPGGVDGFVGPRTRSAITAFQIRKGLTVNADLDDATAVALKDSAGC